VTDAADRDIVMHSTALPVVTGPAAFCSARAPPSRGQADEDADERNVMLTQRRTAHRAADFHGDRHVGGYDELYALDKTGELDRLLGRA
jgi:hypothetical protein